MFDKLTEGMGLSKGQTETRKDKTSDLLKSTIFRPIEEWFRLFI